MANGFKDIFVYLVIHICLVFFILVYFYFSALVFIRVYFLQRAQSLIRLRFLFTSICNKNNYNKKCYN